MAYLNLKNLGETEIVQQVLPAKPSPRPRLNEDKTLITLGLTSAALEKWADELAGVAEAELRVDLPQNWILFCKVRPSGARLLVAHPERGEWVTTLSLEAKLLGLLEKALRNLAGTSNAQGELDLNSHFAESTTIDNVSNVQLILKRV